MRPLIRRVVAIAMLGVYLLLPAAAWVHEEIEHACVEHAASHDPSDHDSEKHHDSSHCQICLTIHASAKQIIAGQVRLIADTQPRVPVARIEIRDLICIDFALPLSPRAPPVAWRRVSLPVLNLQPNAVA